MQLKVKSQVGASLLEVLVSVLILSIGLLGMVGMQTISFQGEQLSMTRAVVADSLANMSDRIRANSDPTLASTTYAYSNAYASERTSIDGSSSFLTPAVNCLTTNCTSAEMAAFDLAEWRSHINRQLPAAVGHIATSGARGVDLRYVITVAWVDATKITESSADTSKRLCSAAGNSTGVGARSCCPAALAHSTAVICSRMEIIP